LGAKPGTTNNPNGRPKKGRALAEQILKAFNKTRLTPDGSSHNGKTILGELLASAVLNGEVVLLSNKKLVLPPREWLELVKFVTVHIDGAARAEVDVTSGGKRIETYDYNSAIATLAPRPDEDSDPPGADQSGGDGPEMGQDLNGG